MSPLDFRSQKLDNNEARKLVIKIMQNNPKGVYFTDHGLKELGNDGLSTIDALNVLKSNDSRVLKDGEYNVKYGNYSYQFGTPKIVLVVSFSMDGNSIRVISGWRKRN